MEAPSHHCDWGLLLLYGDAYVSPCVLLCLMLHSGALYREARVVVLYPGVEAGDVLCGRGDPHRYCRRTPPSPESPPDKDRYREEQKVQTIETVIEKEVNILRWWQKALMWAGAATLIAAVLLAAVKLTKIA